MLSSRDTFLISLLLSLLLLATLIWLSPVTSPSPVARAQSEDACPPLSPPTDPTVDVFTVAQLQTAVNTATSGATIAIRVAALNARWGTSTAKCGVYSRIRLTSRHGTVPCPPLL